MNFRKSKLYKTIVSGTPDNVMKMLWEYLKSGKDVNLKDENTGETLLHLLVHYGERFSSPDTIQAIYMLVCKDIEIDAQDNLGETGLHRVMRKKGAYRIMMALVRYVNTFCYYVLYISSTMNNKSGLVCVLVYINVLCAALYVNGKGLFRRRTFIQSQHYR